MQYIFIFIQWAVSGWCSWAAATLMDTWWFLWIWSADVWPMGFDSLECPVGSIPAWAQPIYFNHDPVGDWSALQLCHSSSAAVLYPERVLCRKGKGGPEMGHKPMCVWGIKLIFTIFTLLDPITLQRGGILWGWFDVPVQNSSLCRSEINFLSSPKWTNLFMPRSRLEFLFYLGYFPLLLITSKKKEK